MAVDYVIVGAGSAGCVLANRLSADHHTRVVLLEAGGRENKQAVHIPAAFSQLFRSEQDWGFDTVAQPQLEGREIYWPRGKMLGGSSSMNAMMWVRGFAADYDGWAGLAGDEWSWDALQPYVERAERVAGAGRDDEGSDGAIAIEAQRDPRSHTADFLTAAQQAGYAREEANLAQPNGFTQTMVTQDGGARFSAVDGYLRPARERRNLRIRTDALATRVLVRDGRARSVECLVDGEVRTISADKEVIICAGTVGTPALLQRSGIGDPEALEDLRIPVVAEAPEVGRNLADHLVAGLILPVEDDTLYSARSPMELAAYMVRRKGMLTSNVAEAYGFVRSTSSVELPDVEIIFSPVAYVGQGLEPPPAHGITIGAILLQPRSTGSVTLTSPDPTVDPLIDPQYLSDPADRETLLAGLAICEHIARQPALTGDGGVEFMVPENGASMGTRERDELALSRYAHTLYHPVGTARMGSDPESVLDPHLRVRGVDGLRVVDASAMPRIIRGHTHAPTVFIAERAADWITAGD